MHYQTSTPNRQIIRADVATLLRWVNRYWLECMAFGFMVYLLQVKNVDIEINFGSPFSEVAASTESILAAPTAGEAGDQPRAMNVSMLESTVATTPATGRAKPTGHAKAPDFNDVAPRVDDPAPHISNLTLILSPDYGKRHKLPEHIIRAKLRRVDDYVRRYAGAARQEMADYGIPASITLAQGLLESNAGDSRLAVESNNHFGIKCRSKCRGCTCRNYSDDSAFDMFRVFESPNESFREHSILLSSARYAKLKDHGRNYKKWAHGLKKCGYATDRRYAEKLIQIIEHLDLHRYDS